MYQNRTPDKRPLAQEIEARFGVMPNFFRTATAAPDLIDKLWTFAKSAYLDSPLPSLFKERLFVYLSRFCPVRYCVVRHVGFLIGEGRPAGDPAALPETIKQVIALLARPARDARALEEALARIEALTGPLNIPAPRTELESDLFDALAIIFLEPRVSERARDAVRCAFGEPTFEILAAYLAFIRTAHYWTETHPELAYEPDMAAVMQQHPDLAALLLDQTEAKRVVEGEALRQALAELTQAKHVVAERDTQLELASKTARVGTFAINFHTGLVKLSPGCAAILGLPESTVEMSTDDANKLVHPEDLVPLELRRDPALLMQQREFVAQFRIRRANDGEVRWIEARSLIFYDQSGKRAQLIGVRIDFTDRKLAADMLAERNLQLELVRQGRPRWQLRL